MGNTEEVNKKNSESKECIRNIENKTNTKTTAFSLLKFQLVKWLIYRSFKFPNQLEKVNIKEFEYDCDDLSIGVRIPFYNEEVNNDMCKFKVDEINYFDYIKSLKTEIDMVGKMGKGKKDVVNFNIMLGTYFPPIKDFEEIIEGVKRNFNIKNGITLMLYPSQITLKNKKNLEELINLGVNKVSIEIGSFSSKFNDVLVEESYDFGELRYILQELKFKNVQMNFYCNLPQQVAEDIFKDVEVGIEIGANSFGLMPSRNISKNDPNYPKVKHTLEMLKIVTEFFKEKDYLMKKRFVYSRAEINNYSSNNIAFGIGTIMHINDFKILKTINLNDYNTKINNNEFPTMQVIKLNSRDQMIRYITYKDYESKINKKDFEKEFNISINKAFGFSLILAKFLKYFVDFGDDLVVTEKGYYVLYPHL